MTPRVRVGNDAKAMDIIVRLLPSRYLLPTALSERAIARSASACGGEA